MAGTPETKPERPGRALVARVILGAMGLSAVVGGIYYASNPVGTVEVDPFRTLSESSILNSGRSGNLPAKAKAPATEEPERPKSISEAERSIATSLVGDKACAECHPGESALHFGSGHARTIRPAPMTAIARWLDGRTVKDPENPDVTWTYSRSTDRLEVERAEADRFHCLELQYGIGSGVNGMTFVSVRPEAGPGLGASGFEHRLSYFSNGPKVDISPGQAVADGAKDKPEVGPHGRTLDEAALDKCLKCHSTVTGKSSETGVDMSVLVPNVGCERCHGPGKAHIEAARRDAPLSELTMPHGSEELSPVLQINLCGECHRRLDNVPQNQINVKNPEIARFQPLGIQLSSCFKFGSTGLKCTSCHEPHSKVKKDTRAYESVCLGCHNPLKQSTCPKSATSGCIDCHMPKRTVSIDFTFHDHWIRRFAAEDAAASR